jgi:hypothetical protein
MGTRARINILDHDKTLVSIYRQFDGYPSGLGQEVADFGSTLTIVNGYTSTGEDQANGMGCFAAQLIKYLKDGIGNVYIRDTSDESQGEEYSYNLSEKEGKVWMSIHTGRVTAFGFPGTAPSEMKSLWEGFCEDFDSDKLEE